MKWGTIWNTTLNFPTGKIQTTESHSTNWCTLKDYNTIWVNGYASMLASVYVCTFIGLFLNVCVSECVCVFVSAQMCASMHVLLSSSMDAQVSCRAACPLTRALTRCSLSLSPSLVGSPSADAREALRVPQEQAPAADGQRSRWGAAASRDG